MKLNEKNNIPDMLGQLGLTRLTVLDIWISFTPKDCQKVVNVTQYPNELKLCFFNKDNVTQWKHLI